MRKSFAARAIQDALPVKTIIAVASLKRTESPLQYWSRLHLEFLLAEQAKFKHPHIS